MSEQMDLVNSMLRCPCCDGAVTLCYDPTMVAGQRNWIRCNECGLRSAYHRTCHSAIAAWNQRARSHLAEMIAGGCGHRGPIHTNECSDECGWFAFWDTDNDADFENRVNCCATEEEAIVALLEKTRAELVALRQEKNEAIGAALAVEQKCYDQAQEIKALRKLREACLGEWIRYEGGYDRGQTRNDAAIAAALQACDEASAPTGDEHTE